MVHDGLPGGVGCESSSDLADAMKGSADLPQQKPNASDADNVTVVIAMPKKSWPASVSGHKVVCGVVQRTFQQSKLGQRTMAAKAQEEQHPVRDETEDMGVAQPQPKQSLPKDDVVVEHLTPEALAHQPTKDSEEQVGHENEERKKRACTSVTPKWAQNQSQDPGNLPPVFSVGRHRARLGVDSLNDNHEPLSCVPDPDRCDADAKVGHAPKILEESKFQRVARCLTSRLEESQTSPVLRKFNSRSAPSQPHGDDEMDRDGRIGELLRQYAVQRSEQREKVLYEERANAMHRRANMISSATKLPGNGAEPKLMGEAHVHNTGAPELPPSSRVKFGAQSVWGCGTTMPTQRSLAHLPSAAASTHASVSWSRMASAPLLSTRTLTQQAKEKELLFDVIHVIDSFFSPQCVHYRREFDCMPATRQTALLELYELHLDLRKQLGWDDDYEQLIDKELSLVLQSCMRRDQVDQPLPVLTAVTSPPPAMTSVSASPPNEQLKDGPTAVPKSTREANQPLQRQPPPPPPSPPVAPHSSLPAALGHSEVVEGEKKIEPSKGDRRSHAQRLTSFEVVLPFPKPPSTRHASVQPRLTAVEKMEAVIHETSLTKSPAAQKIKGAMPQRDAAAVSAAKHNEGRLVSLCCAASSTWGNTVEKNGRRRPKATPRERPPPPSATSSAAQASAMGPDAAPSEPIATAASLSLQRQSRVLPQLPSIAHPQKKEQRGFTPSPVDETSEGTLEHGQEVQRRQGRKMPQILQKACAGPPAGTTQTSPTASPLTLPHAQRPRVTSKTAPAQRSPSTTRPTHRAQCDTAAPVRNNFITGADENLPHCINAVVSPQPDHLKALNSQSLSPPPPLAFRKETQELMPPSPLRSFRATSSLVPDTPSCGMSLPYLLFNMSTERVHVDSDDEDANDGLWRQSSARYCNDDAAELGTHAMPSLFLLQPSPLTSSSPVSDIRTSRVADEAETNRLSGFYELTPAESEVGSAHSDLLFSLKNERPSERYDGNLSMYPIEPGASLYPSSLRLGWQK